ncbi:hypothetical protein M0R45_036058 [Rubus argutus]|uniref:Glycoside hydrolase family 3 N-terminal domain-containing protein n=1 Tax=Rubus argutus TaxID=59490 RepID=A0AAW1VYR6_RUBAR
MARVSLSLVAMLLVWWWVAMVKAEYIKYKDPQQPVAVRVGDLLGRMTLQEKIGQMVQIDRSVANVNTLKTYSIGSVLSGGGSAPLPEASAEDWVNMINGFQKGALSNRLGIPMIYGIDAVHGHNNVYNATIFRIMLGLELPGKDPELVRRIGAATALEVRATGIPYVFAPCIAVCRDPRWGRCYESYSEDHRIVQEMTEIIPGLQGDIPANSRKGVPYVGGNKKVAACAKHFVGFCHIRWEGIDRITSPPHSNYTYSVQASILAGIDMVMVPVNYSEFINDLLYLVKSNVIPMDRIDDAVGRILLVKFTMGLFENPLSDLSLVNELGSQCYVHLPKNYLPKFNALPFKYIKVLINCMYLLTTMDNHIDIIPAHRDLAREAVRKSLVLLKNGKNETNPVLPLPKKVPKILVAGSHADNLGYQCGGWTIAWQGFSGNNYTRGTTILGAIKSTVDSSTEVIYLENPDVKELVTRSTSAGDFGRPCILIVVVALILSLRLKLL